MGGRSFGHHFGQFRTRSRGFLFRGFSGTFLAPLFQNAISLKRRAYLAEMGIGPAFEFAENTRRNRLVTPETPIYGHIKFGNMENRHLKIPHDTPPLRVFETRISHILDFSVSLSGHSQFQLSVFGHTEPPFRPRTPARPTTMATSPTNPGHTNNHPAMHSARQSQ